MKIKNRNAPNDFHFTRKLFTGMNFSVSVLNQNFGFFSQAVAPASRRNVTVYGYNVNNDLTWTNGGFPDFFLKFFHFNICFLKTKFNKGN